MAEKVPHKIFVYVPNSSSFDRFPPSVPGPETTFRPKSDAENDASDEDGFNPKRFKLFFSLHNPFSALNHP